MKKTILFGFLAIIMLSSCKKSDSASNVPKELTANSIAGKWRWISTKTISFYDGKFQKDTIDNDNNTQFFEYLPPETVRWHTGLWPYDEKSITTGKYNIEKKAEKYFYTVDFPCCGAYQATWVGTGEIKFIETNLLSITFERETNFVNVKNSKTVTIQTFRKEVD